MHQDDAQTLQVIVIPANGTSLFRTDPFYKQELLSNSSMSVRVTDQRALSANTTPEQSTQQSYFTFVR